MRTRCLTIVASLLMAARAGAAGPGVELITNGDFETGIFAGWTIDNLPGSGDWFLGTPGLPTPFSTHLTSPNPGGGSFYAVSDQTGPGTHVLRQSFTVPLNATSVTLSYQMFVNDADGGPIFNPVGLDHTVGPNQHARVEIIKAATAPFSTAPGDIVGSFYPEGVDPQALNPNPYTSYSIDVTGLVAPGGTYQLRFGEVDNSGFLNQGVDNVSIVASVPEPATIGMLICGAAMLISWRRNR